MVPRDLGRGRAADLALENGLLRDLNYVFFIYILIN